MVRHRVIGAVAVLSAQLICAATAASPLEDPTLGGSVFTGPVHGHASAMYVNPAALGLTGRGWHLHLGSSLRLNSLWIDRREIDESTLEPVDGQSVSNHELSPGFLLAWYTSVHGGNGHIGAALQVPNSERFPNGRDPLRYHTLGGHMAQVLATIGGSYRFAGRFIIGLGFSLSYSSLELRYARDTAIAGGSDSEDGIASACGDSPCGFENPEADERYDIDASSAMPLLFEEGWFSLQNISASFGVAFRLREATWIAASYSGMPGAFTGLTLHGDARVTPAPRTGQSEVVTGTSEVALRMPHTVYAGLRTPLLRGYDLITTARWQDYSRQDQFDVRLFGGNLSDLDVPEWDPRYRGLHDSWRVGAGVEGNESHELRLGGRVRLETGTTDANRVTPIQVDGLSVTLASGAELRLVERLVISAGYDFTWFPSVDSVDSEFDPRERLACVDSQYDFDFCEAARLGRALPTAAGRYRRLQHAFILSIRYDSL